MSNALAQDAPTRADEVSARGFASLFGRAVMSTALAVVIAASIATMGEIDRLIAQVVSPTGDSWRLREVVGFTPWVAFEAWPAWATNEFQEVTTLIAAHAIVDLAFIAAYLIAGIYLIRYCVAFGMPGGELDDSRRSKRRELWILLGVLVAADAAESLTVILLTFRPPSPVLIGVQVALTVLKWIMVGVLLARILFGETLRIPMKDAVVRIWSGVYGQRLGAVLVIAVAVLTIVSAGGVQDQLPDVYRALIRYPADQTQPLSFNSGPAWAAAVVAIVGAIGLFYFGRQRGYQYSQPSPSRPASLPAWAYTALAIAIIAIVTTAAVARVSFDEWNLSILLLVLAAVPAASSLIRWWLRRHSEAIPEPFIKADTRRRAEQVFRAGDVIVGAWISLVLLAPYVALVTPILLLIAGTFEGTSLRESLGAIILIAVALLLSAILVPALVWAGLQKLLPHTAAAKLDPHVRAVYYRAQAAAEAQTAGAEPAEDADEADAEPVVDAERVADSERVADAEPIGDSEPIGDAEPVLPADPAHRSRTWAERTARARDGLGHLVSAAAVSGDPRPGNSRRANWVGAGGAALAVVWILLVSLFPFIFAKLGPVAVLFSLLGAWSAILGWVILALGRRKPPEVFGALRLRSTPVIALATIVPVLIAAVVGSPTLHAVELDLTPSALQRDDMKTALDRWARDACVTTIEVPGGAPVEARILTLIAAQGGGIRAAAWTVNVARELPRVSDCATDSVFLSVGASGGSVGLAVLARRGDQDPGTTTIAPLARPDALATDVVGLLGSDLVAELTGLRIPSAPIDGSGQFEWRDRAALHADVWGHATGGASSGPTATGLGGVFGRIPSDSVGYVIFNSTDSATNCKVVISQLDLTERTGSEGASCAGTGAELSNTVDLFDHLGRDCGARLTWGTAAMLSARFPFVSPSGRIADETTPPDCTSAWDMQLLDGGLIDNSALGTTSDLLGELGEQIRAVNAIGEEPPILPVVLFMSNEPGADVAVDSSRTRPEIYAPIAAMNAVPSVQSSPSAWLTRLSGTLDDMCPVANSCQTALDALQSEIPGGIVSVSPSTTPSVSVPLGWTLSDLSRSRLRLEADQQRRCGRDPESVDNSYISGRDALAEGDPRCSSSGVYGRYGVFLNYFDPDLSRAPEPTQPAEQGEDAEPAAVP